MENEKIDYLFEKSKKRIANLENSCNELYKVFDELIEFIRINKSSYYLDFENIRNQMNEITKHTNSDINMYSNKIDCFNDVCDYAMLYQKRLSEDINELYEDLYG